MVTRSFYIIIFLLLLPVSLLLTFKPQVWQNAYSKQYTRLTATSKNPFLTGLFKAFLSIASSDVGAIVHRAIGIFLGIIELYIFLEKLKIITLLP
jgi:hypothetical protein